MTTGRVRRPRGKFPYLSLSVFRNGGFKSSARSVSMLLQTGYFGMLKNGAVCDLSVTEVQIPKVARLCRHSIWMLLQRDACVKEPVQGSTRLLLLLYHMCCSGDWYGTARIVGVLRTSYAVRMFSFDGRLSQGRECLCSRQEM